jgi:hypothetical protein
MEGAMRTSEDCEKMMPNLPHDHRRDAPDPHGRHGDEYHMDDAGEIDARQRQNAVLAERNPGSVASALAAFRRRRGFERSSLVAWLRLSPDRLVALTLERRPDPTDSDYGNAVAGMAERYSADPVRLTEALAG